MLFDLIEEYTEIPGPVGHEELVAKRLIEDWTPLCQEVWQNKIGNVMAKVGGKGPKVLITAHMDQINLLVSSVTEDGFCRLTQGTGGSEPTVKPNDTYLNQPVLVKGKDTYYPGLIGIASGHVKIAAQRAKGEVGWDDFFLDLGLWSKGEVEALGIRPGSPVIFASETRRLGHNIIGKAMDDRVGLAIMTILAQKLQGKEYGYEVYYAATIEEEVGLGGSMNLAFEGDFDMAIALEIGLVGDVPTVDFKYMPTRLGKGPIIAHKDACIHYSESVSDKLEEAAERAGMPVQHAVFHGFGSDGDSLIRMGIPTALFTFPTRYTHSPFEMIDEDDVLAMCDILTDMLVNG
ncbi:MAG: M42 family metallopeptidase [Firmicutes bacterium]|nr:M42 family metallopeptidase [Candidatus Fermentithermobacillaceae bacterium]